MSSAAAGSLRLRLLAGTLVWVLLTVVVAGWALGRLFDEHVDRQFRVELRMHLAQLAAQLMIDAEGRPALRTPLSDPRFVRPSSGLYWQVDVLVPESRQAVLRSRSLWDVVLSVPQDLPAAGVFHSHRIEGPDGEPLRLIEQMLYPAEQPEMTLRVIVAANAALVEEPVARFNRLLAIALGVLAGGLVLAALVQVRVGLRPLVRLRDGLAAVRAGRSAALQGSFPAEVQPLVEEFNAVLARNAEVVERARTQAGNLAHAVHTPLSILANAAAQEHSPLALLVQEQVASARRQVDYHLARARAAAAVRATGLCTPVLAPLRALLRTMQSLHVERNLSFELAPQAHDGAFRGEEQDLYELLGNLIDNAGKSARQRVVVDVQLSEGQLCFTVDDDGPGIPEAEREHMFQRGVQLDEQRPGSGLGLDIVRALADTYGGSVQAEVSHLGGARLRLCLPAADGV